jgi:hypothetical protein
VSIWPAWWRSGHPEGIVGKWARGSYCSDGRTTSWVKIKNSSYTQIEGRHDVANRTTYRDHGLVFAKSYGELTNRNDLIGLPLQANHLGQRQFARLS